MKKVWSWIKGHWVVVVCCALIVLTLPAAFIVSRGWSNSIRERQEKAANDLLTKLNTAAKVSYAVPSVLPGVPALEQSAEPNAKRTEFFKTQKEALTGQGAGVVALADQINRRDRKPIMEGIFPQPAPGQDLDSLTLEFAERIVGRPAGPGGTAVPSVYQKLLDQINAGPAADPVRLATLLDDRQQRAIERIKGTDAARQLTAEEQAQITKELVDARIGEYQRRAREISVYATMDVLAPLSDARNNKSWIIRSMPTTPPSLGENFIWQFDYWLMEDVLAAVGRANSAGGKPTDVERSVVKRIEKITLDSAGFDTTNREQVTRSSSSEEGGETEATASETAPVTLDYKASLTGRTSAPENYANGVYDVRRAEITAIVSSQKLPQFLDALSATNFMTVLDCDLSEVNVWGDLAQGYYYGNEHVTRATITVETVWLRSVTKPYMPGVVRGQLNIPDDVKPETEGETKPEDGAGGTG